TIAHVSHRNPETPFVMVWAVIGAQSARIWNRVDTSHNLVSYSQATGRNRKNRGAHGTPCLAWKRRILGKQVTPWGV
ncbi:hypothetical protein PLICRDRAFT_39999, partial [Plicaturopsis crispa FD-325 SS-3]